VGLSRQPKHHARVTVATSGGPAPFIASCMPTLCVAGTAGGGAGRRCAFRPLELFAHLSDGCCDQGHHPVARCWPGPPQRCRLASAATPRSTDGWPTCRPRPDGRASIDPGRTGLTGSALYDEDSEIGRATRSLFVTAPAWTAVRSAKATGVHPPPPSVLDHLISEDVDRGTGGGATGDMTDERSRQHRRRDISSAI
jgi:hypothetical protein